MALLLALTIDACHKEEQAVVNVAQNAANREQEPRAAAARRATERDAQRTEMATIPLPTKSLYMSVHDPAEWKNPFISVDAEFLDLRVTMTDANPSTFTEGTLLRPEGARRHELQIRPD